MKTKQDLGGIKLDAGLIDWKDYKAPVGFFDTPGWTIILTVSLVLIFAALGHLDRIADGVL